MTSAGSRVSRGLVTPAVAELSPSRASEGPGQVQPLTGQETPGPGARGPRSGSHVPPDMRDLPEPVFGDRPCPIPPDCSMVPTRLALRALTTDNSVPGRLWVSLPWSSAALLADWVVSEVPLSLCARMRWLTEPFPHLPRPHAPWVRWDPTALHLTSGLAALSAGPHQVPHASGTCASPQLVEGSGGVAPGESFPEPSMIIWVRRWLCKQLPEATLGLGPSEGCAANDW